MQLFYVEKSDQDFVSGITLSNDEKKHCIKVLRLKKGDIVYVTDGMGMLYKCILTEEFGINNTLEIIEKENKAKNRCFNIHIASALTKNINRMEFFIEKAIEIGIDTFTPLQCKRSERGVFKTERFQKIAVSAMKQSLNLFLPQIEELTSFSDFINSFAKKNDMQKFIAFQNEDSVHLKQIIEKNKDVVILIGPEGDFTKEELHNAISAGFETVTLGKNRLRTETAALYSCALINSFND